MPQTHNTPQEAEDDFYDALEEGETAEPEEVMEEIRKLVK